MLNLDLDCVRFLAPEPDVGHNRRTPILFGLRTQAFIQDVEHLGRWRPLGPRVPGDQRNLALSRHGDAVGKELAVRRQLLLGKRERGVQ